MEQLVLWSERVEEQQFRVAALAGPEHLHKQQTDFWTRVESYIAEYVLAVKEYKYLFTIKDGRLLTADETPLVSLSSRYIDIDKQLGTAETEGLILLEQMVVHSTDGQYFLLASPALEYGFVFVGKKKGDKLEMNAWRWEGKSKQDYREFMNFFQEEGRDTFNDVAGAEFRRRPVAVRKELTEVLRETLIQNGIYGEKDPRLIKIMETIRPRFINSAAINEIIQAAVLEYSKMVGVLYQDVVWNMLDMDGGRPCPGGSGNLLGNLWGKQIFSSGECSIGVCPLCGNREALVPNQVHCSHCGTYLS